MLLLLTHDDWMSHHSADRYIIAVGQVQLKPAVFEGEKVQNISWNKNGI